ncbi:unnamed protein product, partial [Nesidiocoris tenuis]
VILPEDWQNKFWRARSSKKVSSPIRLDVGYLQVCNLATHLYHLSSWVRSGPGNIMNNTRISNCLRSPEPYGMS